MSQAIQYVSMAAAVGGIGFSVVASVPKIGKSIIKNGKKISELFGDSKKITNKVEDLFDDLEGWFKKTKDKDAIEGGSKTGNIPREINHPVLDNTRSGSALKDYDGEHGFNDIIDNYAQYAEEFNLTGGDGIERKLYQIKGGQKSYVYKTVRDNKQNFDVIERTTKDEEGIFEWIVDPNKGVTHRRFIPNGTITGKPNQIPNK